jgi:hypothetical protein
MTAFKPMAWQPALPSSNLHLQLPQKDFPGKNTTSILFNFPQEINLEIKGPDIFPLKTSGLSVY